MVIGTPVVLNLIPGGVTKVVHVNQVNDNIEIQFQIMNGSQPYNVTEGVSCTIRGTKGDSYGYTAEAATTVGSNVVTVTLTEQLTAVAGGCNVFELVFVGAENSMKVSTENFILAVERAALGEDTVISDSDLAYAAQVLDQLQSVGAVNAQVQQNKANIAAEVTRATAAEQTLQQNINSEASARQSADNTLQSNINAEASARAAQDTVLQAEIDQLVAPSGSAPSAAEVTNARIGADGTTYDTLGNAIRGQVTDVKSALGEKYTVLHGSYQSGTWASQYYSAFFKVVPGSTYSITAPSDNTTVYYGLRSASVPPTDGDAADFSTETGWTGTRNTAVGETESGVLPNDVNYLYFYYGTGSQPTARKPVSVIVDGIDLLGNAFDNIAELRLKAAQAEMDIDNMEDAHTNLESKVYAHPYGFEPFQMSMFKQSDNIFSDFCYHLIKRYYRARVDTTVARPRITETSNYQGWLIRVKPNTTYTLGPVDFQIEILTSDFDLSRRFVSGMSSTEPNTITTKSNACWLCLTQRMTRDMSEWMMVEGDTYPSEYVSGYPQWVLDPIPSTGVATPKTIAFMGDSITAGVATAKCYHQYLHDKYGCVCLNYGFGGSGYYRNSASQSSGKHGTGVPGMGVVTSPENFFTPNNIIARLGELDASAINGIVIFAGTNDWGNGVSMENFTDAVDNAFTYCQTNFPLIPVLVMLPIHRKGDTAQNSQGKTLRDYCDVIISMCVKHGLPYVDTMTDSGIYPDNDANKGAYFTTDTSGLHPSALGHKRIASVIWDMLDAIISYPDFQ